LNVKVLAVSDSVALAGALLVALITIGSELEPRMRAGNVAGDVMVNAVELESVGVTRDKLMASVL